MLAKQLCIAVVLLYSFIGTAECNVVYRKYMRTVPPRTGRREKKVTEIVEIFKTHNMPPFYGSSEAEINRFIASDSPQRPGWRPMQRPGSRPGGSGVLTTPKSLWGTPRPTTIRPNPYENQNPNMNYLPPSVTTTKYSPSVNITIREKPTTTTTEKTSTSTTTTSTTEKPTTTTSTTTTTEEPTTAAEEEPVFEEDQDPVIDEETTEEAPKEPEEEENKEEEEKAADPIDDGKSKNELDEENGEEDHYEDEEEEEVEEENEDNYDEEQDDAPKTPAVTTEKFSWFG